MEHCCGDRCFEYIKPITVPPEEKRSFILQHVIKFPCKTHKKDAKKNGYNSRKYSRVYNLLGRDEQLRKVCKGAFMKTVGVSSEFINTALKPVIPKDQENYFSVEATSNGMVSDIFQPIEDNGLPLTVNEFNKELVDPVTDGMSTAQNDVHKNDWTKRIQPHTAFPLRETTPENNGRIFTKKSFSPDRGYSSFESLPNANSLRLTGNSSVLKAVLKILNKHDKMPIESGDSSRFVKGEGQKRKSLKNDGNITPERKRQHKIILSEREIIQDNHSIAPASPAGSNFSLNSDDVDIVRQHIRDRPNMKTSLPEFIPSDDETLAANLGPINIESAKRAADFFSDTREYESIQLQGRPDSKQLRPIVCDSSGDTSTTPTPVSEKRSGPSSPETEQELVDSDGLSSDSESYFTMEKLNIMDEDLENITPTLHQEEGQFANANTEEILRLIPVSPQELQKKQRVDNLKYMTKEDRISPCMDKIDLSRLSIHDDPPSPTRRAKINSYTMQKPEYDEIPRRRGQLIVRVQNENIREIMKNPEESNYEVKSDYDYGSKYQSGQKEIYQWGIKNHGRKQRINKNRNKETINREMQWESGERLVSNEARKRGRTQTGYNYDNGNRIVDNPEKLERRDQRKQLGLNQESENAGVKNKNKRNNIENHDILQSDSRARRNGLNIQQENMKSSNTNVRKNNKSDLSRLTIDDVIPGVPRIEYKTLPDSTSIVRPIPTREKADEQSGSGEIVWRPRISNVTITSAARPPLHEREPITHDAENQPSAFRKYDRYANVETELKTYPQLDHQSPEMTSRTNEHSFHESLYNYKLFKKDIHHIPSTRSNYDQGSVSQENNRRLSANNNYKNTLFLRENASTKLDSTRITRMIESTELNAKAGTIPRQKRKQRQSKGYSSDPEDENVDDAYIVKCTIPFGNTAVTERPKLTNVQSVQASRPSTGPYFPSRNEDIQYRPAGTQALNTLVTHRLAELPDDTRIPLDSSVPYQQEDIPAAHRLPDGSHVSDNVYQRNSPFEDSMRGYECRVKVPDRTINRMHPEGISHEASSNNWPSLNMLCCCFKRNTPT